MNEFEIKERGRLKYFLNIEVAYSTRGIFISQQKNMMDLLISSRGKVCKLRKVLYGLKQSLRSWFGRSTKVLKDFGYKQS